MTVELWQAAIPPLLILAGALPQILKARSQNRMTDAKTLAIQYGGVIDRLEVEVKAVRETCASLQTRLDTRERELGALRVELATERSENARLRGRVEELERQVRGLPRRVDDDSQ